MKRNYNYARLDRGNFEYAPNILYVGDKQIINASAEEYVSFGWLPIIKSEMPESDNGYYFTPIYTESDGKIIQQWEKHEIPDEATETDYINALEDLGVNFGE
jgi:hypothetical protein